ncbi:aspartate racemase [Bacterioplanes sanyensis]|uniref:Aspartate racemase n=2 Tax=Bacterioplanes sanyensis TaxID=1249553 RepID=A0A222FPD6_9GAMM|nr:aspartate/glutamate racemase family protein [Bacterioplanes sanyensis]ASP40875.1 aspartate racemase [Bacterioplanes sanyensis]
MKTIGLIGGMSWESSVTYYQLINRGIQQRLGGLHSASLLMSSLDFAAVAELQAQGQWAALAELLCDHAQRLQNAGADAVMICTNTMHKLAPQVEEAIDVPLLHIADATALSLKQQGITRAGLLGTRFTMEQDFYAARLQQHGIDVLIPNETQRDIVHQVIYQELCRGEINSASRQQYCDIIADLQMQGAGAVILGCTEIGLLVQSQHCSVPLVDTAMVHAQAAVEWMLAE